LTQKKIKTGQLYKQTDENDFIWVFIDLLGIFNNEKLLNQRETDTTLEVKIPPKVFLPFQKNIHFD
jgi:hypothetical protein